MRLSLVRRTIAMGVVILSFDGVFLATTSIGADMGSAKVCKKVNQVKKDQVCKKVGKTLRWVPTTPMTVATPPPTTTTTTVTPVA